MSLDKKLGFVAHWDKHDALECWSRYESLYTAKHYGGLHHAIIGGNLNDYIDKECRVFARYAKMWHYQRTLLRHGIPDLHHVAQANKLKRYQQGGCDPHKFP